MPEFREKAEEILAEHWTALNEGGKETLERLCEEHPDLADVLRARHDDFMWVVSKLDEIKPPSESQYRVTKPLAICEKARFYLSSIHDRPSNSSVPRNESGETMTRAALPIRCFRGSHRSKRIFSVKVDGETALRSIDKRGAFPRSLPAAWFCVESVPSLDSLKAVHPRDFGFEN